MPISLSCRLATPQLAASKEKKASQIFLSHFSWLVRRLSFPRFGVSTTLGALYLMTRFYAHLAEKDTVAHAMTAAKRDILKNYGTQAVPYYWASFKLEGPGDQAVSLNSKRFSAKK